MRKLILAIAVLCGSSAFAAKMDPVTELANYRQSIKGANIVSLIGYQGINVTKSFGTCALSHAAMYSAFITDTVPVTAPVAEWLANKSNKQYSSYEALWSWETLAGMSRGTVGGVSVVTYEFFDFLVKFASGEEKNWDLLKKTYASTFAVTEAVFSEQSRCMVNLAKIAAVRMEMRRSIGLAPYTPMMLPLR